MTSPDQSVEHPDLYPEIKPYDSGFLQVSRRHEIFYEQVGNPEGRPVFVLHGGPGAGCSPAYRRFHDPEVFRIVLHDQRGAGRSRPFGEIRENTTQDLVKDIDRLRLHLGIEQMILFGGSWGSTLALAYAEAHPERVTGLVLRGIFLATREEMERFFPLGTADYFPEAWDRLHSQVPEVPDTTFAQRVLALLEGPDLEVRRQVARAWAAFELRSAFLRRSDEELKDLFETWAPTALARIEAHYMAHDFFLEEGQIERDLAKIRHIPAVLVNGRYDVLTPPIMAWRLHKALPSSKLRIVEACGHSAGDYEMQGALVRAVRELE